MALNCECKLVLIVDDAPESLRIISDSLRQDGYRTKAATTGQKGLVLASAEEKSDLILLDVMIPEMDGYEVCRRLKTNPATREIPVIFITAKSNSGDEEKGFAVGAVRLHPKTVLEADCPG